MPRDFPTRYRRVISGVFAGDAAPAGILSINDPVAGTGLVFRMPIARIDYPSTPPVRRLQGIVTSNLAITTDLQLWISDRNEQVAGAIWCPVGDPFLGVILTRLWESAGQIEDADAFVQITPSAPLGAGDVLTLEMEAVD